MSSFQSLEKKIGYHFQNSSLLSQALTHSSYANEKRLGKLGCNERLEFLGDAVLEMVSSEYLYLRFPSIPEGELTKRRAWPSAPEISSFRSICFLVKEKR